MALRLLPPIFVASLPFMLSATALSAEIVVQQNIRYATVGGKELELDLARPSGRGPFPAIVFIHGGGWYEGDRQSYGAQIREAAKRGYVGVAISYRLMQFDEQRKDTASAKPIFPTQIQDVNTALRWLRNNADQNRIDEERMGLTGASAGGHLALLAALADPNPAMRGGGSDRKPPARVRAVVNLFGPTDMVACYEDSVVAWIIRLFMGGRPEETPETYRKASPIHYVSKDDPPVLTLHGALDVMVPVGQAELLDQKMKAVGAPHQLVVYQDQGHGFKGEAEENAEKALWKFFQQHLQPHRSTRTPENAEPLQ